ncbi:MAG: hypothetical protein IH991_12050, partial [Planctomycetes bacterium]|nr:hypothetical protein [Planctomycetota bacterium]
MRVITWLTIIAFLLLPIVGGSVWFLREAAQSNSESDPRDPNLVGQIENRQTSPEVAAAELDKDKQKVIWDGEHITFELERR